ncbi:MAG: ABC transporter permease [Actinomycetota bacterium]|nr:ABC transporter permease [Actinomycetota bacterium]
MSVLGSTALVAGRELRETFRRRSFWIVLGVMFIASCAAMILPDALSDDSNPRYDVAVIGDEPELEALLTAVTRQLDIDVDYRRAADIDEASRLVEDDRLDLALIGGDDPRIVARADQSGRIMVAVRQALTTRAMTEQLSAEGLDAEQIREALSVPPPRLIEVDEESSGRQATAFVISFVLYLLLLTLMVQVANGVAVEKSNRISEVLLAVVKPAALLFGKVIGVCIVGIGTLLAVAVPVIVKMVLGGSLPEGIGAAIAGSALWFLLGLALYLTIAGALGALAERQEQTGSVIAPLTFLLIGTFIVAQSSADSVLGTVLAYFPLTSPLMMPFRIALGEATVVEIVGSLVLLVLSIVAAARIGSTIYARAIVRTGRKLTIREALQSS